MKQDADDVPQQLRTNKDKMLQIDAKMHSAGMTAGGVQV